MADEQGAQLDPREAMMRIVNGYMVSQCIYVVAKLGIADLVHEGPKNSRQLAEATNAHPGSLYRVLSTLSTLGIFSEDEDGCFSLTRMSELLRSGTPDSLRGWATFRGDKICWQPWGEILHAVETGESGFARAFDAPAFDYLGKNPESARVFDDAMRSISERKFRAVAKTCDLSGAETIVDVAGGNGGMIAAILNQNPQARGILAERPHVMDDARSHIAAAGLADRCQCVPIDMFESVPEGGDAYLMANIVHDWDDERSIKILRNCQRAMRPDGRVLLVELVLGPRNEPSLSHLMDIEMLVMTEGGRERTEAEYAALYEAAGLQLTKAIPTDSWWSILEAKTGDTCTISSFSG